MPVTLAYDDTVARVRITVDSDTTVQRSTDGVHWDFVRGAADPVTTGSTIDDYEFGAGVVNHYRDASNTVSSITPNMTNAWFKFVGRPYLNTRLLLTGWDEIKRSSRNGVFDVKGRVNPIVVSDVHSSRSTTIQVRTTTVQDRDNLDLALALGQVAFLHVPPTAVLPSMYCVPGNYGYSRPTPRSQVSNWDIPITEVAKPGPGVYGTAGTWLTVSTKWSSWSDVSAPTYGDLASVVGSPAEVIVS